MQEEEDTGWWSEPIVLRLDDDGDDNDDGDDGDGGDGDDDGDGDGDDNDDDDDDDGDDDGWPTCKRRRTKDGRVSKLF